jgi:hypothetical protein
MRKGQFKTAPLFICIPSHRDVPLGVGADVKFAVGENITRMPKLAFRNIVECSAFIILSLHLRSLLWAHHYKLNRLQ